VDNEEGESRIIVNNAAEPPRRKRFSVADATKAYEDGFAHGCEAQIKDIIKDITELDEVDRSIVLAMLSIKLDEVEPRRKLVGKNLGMEVL